MKTFNILMVYMVYVYLFFFFFTIGEVVYKYIGIHISIMRVANVHVLNTISRRILSFIHMVKCKK